MKEVIGGAIEAVYMAPRKDAKSLAMEAAVDRIDKLMTKKWDLAKAAAFPDSVPGNITYDGYESYIQEAKDAKENLRLAIEEKRKAEAQNPQNPQQSQIYGLRAIAAQQNARRNAAWGQQLAQQQYGGVTSYPNGIIWSQDEVSPTKPKREAKPKAPDKTTEEAQRELTETGRRKIILDEEK